MTSETEQAPWLRDLIDTVERKGRSGHFIVTGMVYRPSLFAITANALGVRFFDFRKSVMASHGRDAGQLPLTALDEAIAELAKAGGGLCHNAEALLASKSACERKAWLARFLEIDSGPMVVLPVVVFSGELPESAGRIAVLPDDEIPEESFLMRLLYADHKEPLSGANS